MPGQSSTDLLAQIRRGNNQKARITTMLQGIVRQVQAMKTDPAALTEWGTKMTGGQIEQYCQAIEGTTAIAGQGAAGGGRTGG